MVGFAKELEVQIEFREVVRRRRMVRQFDARPLPAGLLDRILADALRGPSAGFAQGFELLALEGPEETARFWTAAQPADRAREKWPAVVEAPAIVVVFADEPAYRARFGEPDKSARIQVPWWWVDTAYAVMLMLLSAVDSGVGASFFGVTEPGAVREEFGVPSGFAVLGAVALGYPASGDRPSRSAARGRRPFAEVVHRGQW
jgi:nitroreductase